MKTIDFLWILFLSIVLGTLMMILMVPFAHAYDRYDRYGEQYYSNPSYNYNSAPRVAPLGRGDSLYQIDIGPNVRHYQYNDYDERSGRRSTRTFNCVTLEGGYQQCY